MKTLSIEERLQLLEDKEAIKDISYQYALHINQGWNGISINPNELSKLFAENAIWESPIMNIREIGLENFKSLRNETQTVLFAMHSYFNPVININGNTAAGNWLFWVVSKMEKDKTNQVFMSQDIQLCKKTEKGWRIQNVLLNFGDIVTNKRQD